MRESTSVKHGAGAVLGKVPGRRRRLQTRFPLLLARELGSLCRADGETGLLDIATSALPYLVMLVAIYFRFGSRTCLYLRSRSPQPASCFAHSSSFTTAPTRPSSVRGAPTGRGSALGCCLHAVRNWRHEHAVHHATAGDLDRRGMATSDVDGAEYRGRPWWGGSAIASSQPVRHAWARPRCGRSWWGPAVPVCERARIRYSVIGTDLALVALLGALVSCWAGARS